MLGTTLHDLPAVARSLSAPPLLQWFGGAAEQGRSREVRKAAWMTSGFTYKTNWKYKLSDPYEYKLPHSLKESGREPRLLIDSNNSILLKLTHDVLQFSVGYAWDGPSGPTIDTKNSIRASLLHDGLYQSLRLGWLQPTARQVADREFRRILKEDGMSWPRRWLWYLGVRCAGAHAATP